MDSESKDEDAVRHLAAELFFRLEKRGSLYSLYREVDVREPVRREGLTLDQAKEILSTWKMRGFHGG